MPDIRAAGVLIFRHDPVLSFLLMKHKDRWDLPKGHVDEGETEFECALRELQEETGISPEEIVVDNRFQYVIEYEVRVARHQFVPKQKRVTLYLAWLKGKGEICLTEHIGYEWLPWSPPHLIQAETIDGLLGEVEQHFHLYGAKPPDN